MKNLKGAQAPALPRAATMLAVLAVLAGLAGCTPPGNSPGGMTHTMFGTVSLTGLSATGNVVVTATLNGYPYTASVAAPPSYYGVQSASYSIAGIPTGTYSVSVTIQSPSATVYGTYQVDGGSQVNDNPTSAGTGPYTWTMTVSGLQVAGDTQLGASMN